MDERMAAPDEVVKYVLEELAMEDSGGLSLNQLWQIVESKMAIELDHLYRRVVWKWLTNEPDFIVNLNGQDVFSNTQDLDQLVSGFADKVLVKTTEDRKYIFLTDTPKSSSSLGEKPIALLRAIAKSRERGIYTPELSRITGQDPRSFTSRIGLLVDNKLVYRFKIESKGLAQQLLIFRKFFVRSSLHNHSIVAEKKKINTAREIVDLIKSSPSGVRSQNDLRKQLKFHKDKRGTRFFRAMVRYLNEIGCLKSVHVLLQDPPVKVNSLMYVKDVPEDEEDNTSDIEQLLNDEQAGDDDLEDEMASTEISDAAISTDLKMMSSIQDPSEDAVVLPLFNSVTPVHNQVLDLVTQYSQRGITSMEVNKRLMGSTSVETQRFLSRFLPYLTEDEKKMSERVCSGDYRIIRGYDFEGKVRFYRYFTENNYLKRMGQTAKQVDTINLQEELGLTFNKSLLDLSTEMYRPFSEAMKVVSVDGVERVYFFGDAVNANGGSRQQRTSQVYLASAPDNDMPIGPPSQACTSSTGRRKGRPSKKDALAATATAAAAAAQIMAKPTVFGEYPAIPGDGMIENCRSGLKRKISSVSYSYAPSVISQTPAQQIPQFSLPHEVQQVQQSQHGSFKAARRQQALLQLMRENGGVVVVDAHFRLKLDERMGSNTYTDKKTILRDIRVLEESGEMAQEDFVVGRANAVSVSKIVIVDARNRPSEEAIEAAKANALMADTFRTPRQTPIETIQADLTFYSINPPMSKQQRLMRLHETKRRVSRVRPVKVAKAAKPLQPKIKTRKRKLREKSETPTPFDLMEEYAGKRRKRYSSKRSSSERKLRRRSTLRVDRTNFFLVVKAAIVTKSISPNSVTEWEKIAELFQGDDVTGELIRKKWPRIRTVFGSNAIARMREIWEEYLMERVKEGHVSEQDLREGDLEYFLKLWDSSNIDQEYQNHSSFKLLEAVEENCNGMSFVADERDFKFNFFRDHFSQIEREECLNQVSFAVPLGGSDKKKDTEKDTEQDTEKDTEKDKKNTEKDLKNTEKDLKNTEKDKKNTEKDLKNTQDDTLLEQTKTALKAMFAMKPEKFTQEKSRQLLEQFGESLCKQALFELESAKQIVYLGNTSPVKFQITDKVVGKLRNGTFLAETKHFANSLIDALPTHKGLVLSPAIHDTAMAVVLEMMVSSLVQLDRVDYSLEKLFSGYATRSMNKERLECDFILSRGSGDIAKFATNPVPIPHGRPCSRIWIDLNGEINKDLWLRIVSSVVFYIVFRPGVSTSVLCDKFSYAIRQGEVEEVLQWLVDKGAVRRGEFESYYANRQWVVVL